MPDLTQISCLKLDLNTDCIRWCPFNPEDDSYNGLLLCGCYQLIDGVRQGALEFYHLDSEVNLQKISCLKTPGVFRLEWLIRPNSGPTVAAVFTDGSYREFNVSSIREPKESLSLPMSGSALLTSFCSTENTSIACGSSDGKLHTADLETAKVTNSWVGHSVYGAGSEIWTLASEPDSREIFYSGADDAILKKWDTRCDSQVQTVVKNGHSAGVTNILFEENSSEFLLTGSYDETLRRWDRRKLVEPISEYSAGGGVWDMTWCPSGGNADTVASVLGRTPSPGYGRIALACMYGGFKILDQKEPWTAVADSKLPSSALLYGVSWRYPKSAGDRSTCLATCSFYDNCVFVWKVEI